MIENYLKISYGLIFVNSTITITSLASSIDQNLQYVDVNTWKVYEHYEINKEKMLRDLGFFRNDFTYIPTTNSSFEERRSNFQGYQIKAITGSFAPYIRIDYSTATLNNESQTYDVTTSVKGLLMDLLQDMMKYVNFSATLHEREDKKWGPVIALDNGTIIADGIIESVTSGFAELVVTW